jgi:hypothetical protein
MLPLLLLLLEPSVGCKILAAIAIAVGVAISQPYPEPKLYTENWKVLRPGV